MTVGFESSSISSLSTTDSLSSTCNINGVDPTRFIALWIGSGRVGFVFVVGRVEWVCIAHGIFRNLKEGGGTFQVYIFKSVQIIAQENFFSHYRA